jgi:hypothetical protein
VIDWGLLAFALLVLYCIALLAFLGRYLTRSPWRATPLGPLIVYFIGLNLVGWLGIVGLAFVTVGSATEAGFAIVFGLLLAVMVRLFIMLIRAQRVERRDTEE